MCFCRKQLHDGRRRNAHRTCWGTCRDHDMEIRETGNHNLSAGVCIYIAIYIFIHRYAHHRGFVMCIPEVEFKYSQSCNNGRHYPVKINESQDEWVTFTHFLNSNCRTHQLRTTQICFVFFPFSGVSGQFNCWILKNAGVQQDDESETG